ncbi:hypothetical protein DL764_004456 [Monosporascus ibericus]|uniref:Sulfatase N-terminal domain-containing protein n=1 Tax=Monosporascus ibericus TaxID=155417 RepID=A0A4Q4TCN8_9PEZI|nr:hypothetical protein DL764_004456 [Monosporascus ibericus]
MTAPCGHDAWELYEMEADPSEVRDPAEREPEVLKRLVQHRNVYYGETSIFDPDMVYHIVKDKCPQFQLAAVERQSMASSLPGDTNPRGSDGPVAPIVPAAHDQDLCLAEHANRDLVEEQPVDILEDAPLALGQVEEGETAPRTAAVPRMKPTLAPGAAYGAFRR